MNDQFKMVMISNRGTQVWPTGSIFTELVNQYRIRFEHINGGTFTQREVLGLAAEVSDVVKVCSTEMLMKFGDKLGYSLAQGQ
jgi:isocitrate dehydrogenase